LVVGRGVGAREAANGHSQCLSEEAVIGRRRRWPVAPNRDGRSALPGGRPPEAMLNGWIMAILVVFRPEWVYSFSDEQYLKGK
jgi:hypothetical protein